MEKVFFIAVNFNNSKCTIKYIESVQKIISGATKVEIIIVDNNSEIRDVLNIENSIKVLKNIKLIKNKKNIGYFRALNVGICDVIDKRNALFVVSNNDLTFKEDFILELKKIKYDNDTLILAPNIITRDGYYQNPHYINKMSKLRKLGFRLYFTNYYIGFFLLWLKQKLKKFKPQFQNKEHAKQQFIHMGVGACYILTENFINFFSKLDERVFLWGEESLLAGQLDSVGGKTLYTPSLVLYHDESASVDKIPSKLAYKIGQQSYKIYSKYQ